MSAPITIRPYQPGDEASLLKGHNQIFPERSLAHWQWKFGNNPTGQIHTMVADHEQAGIVGAYVTLPVHAAIEGQRRIIGQCVDLWVQPEHRRFGPRPGLFVNLALAHYETWSGKGELQNSFHHGWPIATWRIGQKYLQYEMVRDWDFLFRQVPEGGLPPLWTLVAAAALAAALTALILAVPGADTFRDIAGFVTSFAAFTAIVATFTSGAWIFAAVVAAIWVLALRLQSLGDAQ